MYEQIKIKQTLQKEKRRTISNEGNTAQKMKFSLKGFFSKCDQKRSFLRIWSHLLNKSLLENPFCAGKC